ncbi:YajQ family cyclic di-GMP-binding protein [Beggiatoa alba]|nr:YajQ family cyclic di-GMP-binding protein [Beggiatoa alba]
MPSFDVVSEIDMHEVSNAVDQASRELSTRFDFRGKDASFERVDDSINMTAQAEFQLQQMLDILQNKMHKRGIDIFCLDVQDHVQSGKQVKQLVKLRQGIEQADAKKMIKLIKDSKLKVQTAIQGEKLRVNGKKRDELQAVISLLKQADLEIPLQYENFRD